MGIKGNLPVMGDCLDPLNPYQWSMVTLNLLELRCYNASKPWVYKVRLDGKLLVIPWSTLMMGNAWTMIKRHAGKPLIIFVPTLVG